VAVPKTNAVMLSCGVSFVDIDRARASVAGDVNTAPAKTAAAPAIPKAE
jgi:hypothetical protein